MAYIVGDAITLTASFYNASETLTDPTDVTLQIKSPGGTVTTYTYSLDEITKSSTGVYTKTIALSQSGLHYYEWQGTGSLAKVGNGKFNVKAQLI